MIKIAYGFLGFSGLVLTGFPVSGQAQSATGITGAFLEEACDPTGSEEFCSGTFVVAYQFLMTGCFQAHHFGHRADLIEADMSGVSAWELQEEFMYRMSDSAFFAEYGSRDAVFGIGKVAGDRWPC